MTSYKFTEGHDWFSPGLPQWEELLSPLVGSPCYLLEIGSYEGRSSFWMAENLLKHHSYARLTCIDSWTIDSQYGPNGEAAFDCNLAACPYKEQILKLTGYSQDVLPALSKRYDFAYIDGSHEARDVVTDWVLVLRLMKVGGLICLDDYEWDDPYRTVRILPKPAIDAVLDFWADKIEVLHKERQVWIRVLS
jgi:predicted O-methyltransferase YrrM